MADAIEQNTNAKRLEAKSADYAAMQNYQDDVADILIGQEAIKLAQTRYLPKYPDETDAEYDFRLQYAKFTNIWRDVVEGLASKPFEEPVRFDDTKTVSEEYKTFAANVDGSGRSMTVFAMDYFFYGIAYSCDWLFVDFPVVEVTPGTVRTKAQDKADGVRPLWSRVNVRNVYEVRTEIIKGEESVSYIRFFEPPKGDKDKGFREFQMVGGQATWIIWRWNEKARDYEIEDKGIFAIGVIPMVPFMTGRRQGLTFQTYPAMKDAKELQLTLYQEETNLEVTKVYAAYPMLVGVGVSPSMSGGDNPKPQRLIRGPGIALYAPFTGAGHQTDWKYIEPGAQTLVFLSADIKATKQDLRELGKQPLTVSSGNLTVITTAVAAGKAKSAVKAWAELLSNALTMGMKFTAMWMNDAANAPKVQVYDDFDEFLEPGQDVNALISMNDKGKLSDETLWSEMQRRKILPATFDPEEEKKKLLAQVPNQDTLNDPTNQPPQ